MNTLKAAAQAALGLALGACATSSQTFAPDGKAAYTINCSGGGFRHWGLCYEKAGDLCGSKGYNILERMEDQGSQGFENQFGGFGESTNTRSLLISCK